MTHSRRHLIFLALIGLATFAIAQQAKTTPLSAAVTGHYEGTAKNKAEDVITVALELAEKDGALSGTINSSHGDFAITGGSHKGDAVTIEFDAGSPGTISMTMNNDRMVGTWTAGEDGGAIDVKKAAPKPDAPKGKS
jgi:hypothetical protein